MRFKKTIAASAVALGVLSLGGAAMASGSGSDTPGEATEQTQSGDTDNVQDEVGDQNSPDAPGEAEAAGEESGSESASESDGPGGHADAGDNVDHQFDGEE